VSEQERFRRIEGLFHRLVELDREARAAALGELQRDDPEAHAELVVLVAESQARSAREKVIDGWAEDSRLLDVALPLPERIGPYRIQRLLGEGGMGRVYEALQDEPVRRRVALKVMRRDVLSAAGVARFHAERHTLALLEHPHIARMFDAGSEADGSPWFAMEFVDGVPITRWAAARQLGLRERIELLLPICDAVQHAHQKGVIHRDIKPSNLLVSDVEGRGLAKVIDFGIAKLSGVDAERTATLAGELVGTPEYMSPEQATLGSVDVDTRSDVYALGLVLYELLAGELPLSLVELRRLAFDEMCRRIREEEAPAPSVKLALSGSQDRRATPGASWVSQLRGDLDAVVLKALAKDRGRRYDSASFFAADLRRYLANEPVLATPPSRAYRLAKFARRHRAASVAAITMLLALSISAVVASAGWIEARHALQRAEIARNSAEASSNFLRELFRAADPRKNPGRTPDARELLARGIERAQTLDADPLTRASVLESMADVALALGDTQQTAPLLDEAIALRESGPAADPERLAFLLDRRAALTRERGALGPAERDLKRALQTLEAAGLQDSEAYLRSLSNLGIVLRRSGDLEAAETIYLRALHLARASDKRNAVASILTNLAAVQQSARDFAAARATLDEALTLFQELLPAQHPSFGVLYSNRALIARNEGELGLALFSARQAKAIEDANLPPTHPDRADTLHGEAAALSRLGDLSSAEQRLRQAIHILTTSLGVDSPRLAVPGDSLAQLLRLQGNAAEAEQRLRSIDQTLRASAAAAAASHRISLLRQLGLAQRT
jgi:non-specific serine/threonine protein kinase/serine/threonine-protein kinase